MEPLSNFPKKILTNGHLALLAVVAAVAVTAVALAFLFSNPKAQWAKLQSSLSIRSLPQVTDTVKTKNGVLRIAHVPILMYHHIGDLPPIASAVRVDLTVPTANFEQQVKWLRDQGYTSITLDDLILYKDGKFTMPSKPVIFTFDDGYSDVFQNAVPILKKYGFTGSFGVITQFPGITTGDNQYATWDQIRAAAAQGMEIISHTQDHFDEANSIYNDTFILNNLRGSRADLKSNLGKALPILIYPYGHYDARYIKLAEQSGFLMGITTAEGSKIESDKLMEVPRLRVHGDESLDAFERIVKE